MKVVLSAEAEADLAQIGDHIATDNPIRARSFVRELRQKAKQIADMPRGYVLIPRYEQSGLRRRPVGDYLIFYRIEAERITVTNILHGARDWTALLFPEEG